MICIIEALCKFYQVDYLINVSVRDGKISHWGDNRLPEPDDTTILNAINSYKNNELKIRDIKSIAADKIKKFAPEYKQLNALREGDHNGIFPRIDAIRNYSNLLESKVLNGEDVDINTGWSE